MANEKGSLRLNHRALHSRNPDNPGGGRPFPKPFLEKNQGFFHSLGLNLYRTSRQIADPAGQFKFLGSPCRPMAEAYSLHSALDKKMSPPDH